MYGFYCIFAQFIQFPVHDFGLDHYASQPFNYTDHEKRLVLAVVHVSVCATCTSKLFLFVLELSYKNSVLQSENVCIFSVLMQSFTLISMIPIIILRLLDMLSLYHFNLLLLVYKMTIHSTTRVLHMHTSHCAEVLYTMAIHHIAMYQARSFVVVACV